MADSRVASRYVKSLLGLAEEQGALELVNADMQLFASVCASNKDFTRMLKSPVIRHDKKLAILEAIFEGKVNKLTMAIISMLTRKNREPLLPAIAVEFHNAYNVNKGIQKASVSTTFALDAKMKAEIEELVKKISGKTAIELQEKINPDLIGGFVLHVGDKQIDASIKSKLKALKTKFSENPYIKDF